MSNGWKNLSGTRKLSIIYLSFILMMVPVGIFGVYKATSVSPQAVKELAIVNPIDLEGKIGNSCMVSGCSSELCVKATNGPVNSICVWKDEFACYGGFGKCELQPSGQCGWTQTFELDNCLGDSLSAGVETQYLGPPVTATPIVNTPSPVMIVTNTPNPIVTPAKEPKEIFLPESVDPTSELPVETAVTDASQPVIPNAESLLDETNNLVADERIENDPIFNGDVKTSIVPSTAIGSVFENIPPKISFNIFGREFNFTLPTYLITLFTR